MAKFALLIGVSDYQFGLNHLPNAPVNVRSLTEILTHPDIGGFFEKDVRQVINPDSQELCEAIDGLFFNRTRDDLVLLYFNGHAIRDDSGKFYFATSKTLTSPEGKLRKSTVVSAGFLHDVMNDCRSKQQIIILECCFGGAFAKGLDITMRGRVILTSSASTQYTICSLDSSHSQKIAPSLYTNYLIEGIATGAADQNCDGMISMDELHDYINEKMQDLVPEMQPAIYAAREDYKIPIARVLKS